MNREMLKECIADAKTIRETAIASAKVALEEAFTPQLTAMFAERLNELEEEEEMKNESVDEMYSMEEEELEENFNLDEILAELEMTDEGAEMEEEGMTEESLDEDLMLEEMSDEEIEELVMQVIDDMIASGKLMPGEGEEEGEEEEMEDMEGEEEMEEIDEDINLEELLAEMDSEEKVEEGLLDKIKKFVGGKVGEAESAFIKQNQADFDALKAAEKSNDKEAIKQLQTKLTTALGSFKPSQFGVEGSDISLVLKNLRDVITNVDPNDERSLLQKLATGAGEGREKVIGEDTISELEEAYAAIAELRNELNEVNLLNAKLLYTNKIFKAKNLTESEKIKVLNTFDKAETVKEVKLVFETLTESLKATTAKKNPIKESLGSASKTISTATPKQPIIESNDAFARMQRLAGLKK